MNVKDKKIILFIASIIIYILFVAFLIIKGLVFNEHNRLLTIVILSFTIISIYSLFRLFLKMQFEENVILRNSNKAINSIDDINEIENILPTSLIKERLRNIKTIYEQSKKINYQEIEYLTVRKQNYIGFVEKYIVNATILIGWLGTFLGIILSISYLNINDENASFPLIEGIINGLYLAIGSSILGILSSLILGFVFTIYKSYENNVFTLLEEFSILKIIPMYSNAENSLISKAITEGVNKVLPNIIKHSTTELKEATKNIKEATKEINLNQNHINNLIIQVEKSFSDASHNHKIVQNLLNSFNDNISNIRPTMDELTNVILENRIEFKKVNENNSLNQKLTKEILDFELKNSNFLNSILNNSMVYFNEFSQKSEQANSTFSSNISTEIKIMTESINSNNNKIVELHNSLITSIIKIEKSRNEVIILNDKKKNDLTIKPKKDNWFFSIFNK